MRVSEFTLQAAVQSTSRAAMATGLPRGKSTNTQIAARTHTHTHTHTHSPHEAPSVTHTLQGDSVVCFITPDSVQGGGRWGGGGGGGSTWRKDSMR